MINLLKEVKKFIYGLFALLFYSQKDIIAIYIKIYALYLPQNVYSEVWKRAGEIMLECEVVGWRSRIYCTYRCLENSG